MYLYQVCYNMFCIENSAYGQMVRVQNDGSVYGQKLLKVYLKDFLNIMKLTQFNHMYKRIFRIKFNFNNVIFSSTA